MAAPQKHAGQRGCTIAFMQRHYRPFVSASFCIPVILAAAALQTPALRGQTSASTGRILFVGSSIFAFWTHLNEQMAPLPVINRAFPGAVTQDMLNRAEQLVLPLKPRIIVFYCGSNDVSVGEPAGAILGRTKQFIKVVHDKLPNTFIYYTSIQKAPEKRDRWDVVEAVNQEMERYSHQTANLGYMDLNPVLFDRRGNLREDLFLPDQLHFRPGSSAYAEFAQIVKPILTKAWAEGVGLAANSPVSESCQVK
jgi:lysophospholipase L1-like esterase